MTSLESRTCLGCEGSGRNVQEAFTFTDQETGRSTDYPRRVRRCYGCNGSGTFPPLDEIAIRTTIMGRRGLRSTRPKDPRAYYVWRNARFSGGADVTMPMQAASEVRHDPFKPELDALADTVAREVFGTDIAAAHRWGRALGYLDRDVDSLPLSAYEGGPVTDEDKPDEEAAELR